MTDSILYLAFCVGVAMMAYGFGFHDGHMDADKLKQIIDADKQHEANEAARKSNN